MDSPQPLTPREFETLELIAAGHSNKSIGSELGISVKTVEAHRARIFRKLEAQNAPHAIYLAITRGILVLPEDSQHQVASPNFIDEVGLAELADTEPTAF